MIMNWRRMKDIRMGQLIERSLVTNSLTMDKSHQNTKLCYLVSFTEWNGKQNAELTKYGMCNVGCGCVFTKICLDLTGYFNR